MLYYNNLINSIYIYFMVLLLYIKKKLLILLMAKKKEIDKIFNIFGNDNTILGRERKKEREITQKRKNKKCFF